MPRLVHAGSVAYLIIVFAVDAGVDMMYRPGESSLTREPAQVPSGRKIRTPALLSGDIMSWIEFTWSSSIMKGIAFAVSNTVHFRIYSLPGTAG